MLAELLAQDGRRPSPPRSRSRCLGRALAASPEPLLSTASPVPIGRAPQLGSRFTTIASCVAICLGSLPAGHREPPAWEPVDYRRAGTGSSLTTWALVTPTAARAAAVSTVRPLSTATMRSGLRSAAIAARASRSRSYGTMHFSRVVLAAYCCLSLRPSRSRRCAGRRARGRTRVDRAPAPRCRPGPPRRSIAADPVLEDHPATLVGCAAAAAGLT
jgi:hypothetical protein